MKDVTRSIQDRVASYGWTSVSASLDEAGWAPLSGLLTDAECRELAALSANDENFRSRVVMERHGYGRGERCARAPASFARGGGAPSA